MVLLSLVFWLIFISCILGIMLDSKIRTIKDRPKPWVNFKDITLLLRDSEGLQQVAHRFSEHYKTMDIDVVVGIESRGFIFGAILAQMLGVWFVPIRKKGKLPAETISTDYALEYGTATIEIHKDAIQQWQKVVVIDDLIATGGSCLASCKLIEQLGWEIVEVATVIDLVFLWGSEKIRNAGYHVFSLLDYMG